MASIPRKILMVRLSAIGDTVHGLPVLNALRDRYSTARIAWVAESVPATILAGHPALDELITVTKGWLSSPTEVMKLRRRVREFGPDIALDLQSLTKSALIAWMSGARRRLAFDRPDGREASLWLNTTLTKGTRPHVVDRYLELLSQLGIERPSARFEIPRDSQAEAFAESCLQQYLGQQEFIVLNQGASWTSKLWPCERFARLARWLGDQKGIPTLISWAGHHEAARAQEIVANSGGHARQAPRMTLPQLASICRRARMFVSSDTGPLHLAAAVGTPCIGLFGPTRGERNGPYGPAHIVLQAPRTMYANRRQRKTSDIAMRQIPVESVIEACESLLATSRESAA